MRSALLPLILGSTLLGNARVYNIHNNCPKAIEVQISSHKTVKLTLNAFGDRQVLYDDIVGIVTLVSTQAAEFSDNVASIVAGFFEDFYSLAVDPKHFNAGVRVAPYSRRLDSSCEATECGGPGCPGTTVSPLLKDAYAASPSPPSPPIYQCPEDSVVDIIFCPTGQFPGHEGLHLKFSSDEQTKCLGVQGDALNDGTLVQIYECNSSATQRWIINNKWEKVQLAGTNYCLGAGTDSGPANGNQLGIWLCSDLALPAQQWIYTPDHRVALKDQGFCMDVEDGRMIDGGKVQTWKCTDNNSNQIWSVGN